MDLLRYRSNAKVESTGHVPDAKTQEQQFFLARRIPSCLWREASKSPIRRAHGSRLISRVLREVVPSPLSLDIHASQLRIVGDTDTSRGWNNHPERRRRRTKTHREREEREKGTSICYITRINNYSGAQQLL